MRIDVATLRRQVEALKASYPELEEDETLFADTIEGETDVYEVLADLVRREQSAKHQAKAVYAYCESLQARAARFERQQEAARELIKRVMDAAGLRKAPLPEATLSVSAGRPKLIITDLAAIPAEFTETVTETRPDKAAIKEALQTGKAVDGAILSNAEPVLSIRVA